MAKPRTDESAEISLHICPACGSHLVQPVAWKPEDSFTRWLVQRRCPDCRWAGESVHDEVTVDAYDEQLDLGSHELAAELRSLEHANMSAMVASFIRAIETDLITADDFRSSPGRRGGAQL